MKVTKLNKVEKQEFNDIYSKKSFKKDKTWEVLFKDIMKQVDHFSSSLSFWYVADFAKGVVKVGGDCDLATPLKKKDWIGLNPWDIGAMFHPMDEAKMRAFIVFVAGFLAQKKDIEREKIKISLVFRMLNAHNQYTWRVMEYPAMHYQNNEPRYLLCHVSEINHLLNQPK